MRIAFIEPFLFRYARGIERFTINLANALTHRGVEVHILTWRWPRPIRIERLDSRVQIHWVPAARYFAAKAAVPFYIWDLLTHDYDFVWVFFAGYGEGEAITLASRFRAIRYGISIHYPFAQVPHRYQEFKRFSFAQHARTVVTVSTFVAEGAKEALGRDCVVISNGVNVSQFAPNADLRKQHRAALGLDDTADVLLTVAALEERKGIQHILRALPIVRTFQPSIKYLVVGEGPYRPALESQIQQSSLNDCVTLAGIAEDIYPYYNSADIFLLLASGEAMPIAPLEAMAMELPLVVADRRPFDEFVRPQFGLRVVEQDETRVADAICSLLADADRRHSMGKSGRASILNTYTWERVAAQYLEVGENRA